MLYVQYMLKHKAAFIYEAFIFTRASKLLLNTL